MKDINTVPQEIVEFANSISTMTNGCKFISLQYRNKSANELARHTLLVGFSYHQLVVKSVAEQTELLPTFTGDKLTAANNVMASLQKTLAAHARDEQNPDYTKKGMYAPVRNGVSINTNDNSIQLFGLSVSKVVLEPGMYKTVNSKPMTILQNEVKELLSVTKFREFALDAGVVLAGKVNGKTFEIEEIGRAHV